MDDAAPKRWLGIAILVGAAYCAAALISSMLAGAVASDQMRFFWRLSAFIISGVVLLAHIAYEHYHLRNTTLLTAWHVSLAAAFGGLALALAANIHDLFSAAGYRPRMLVALIAWPLLTGVPAFIVALGIAAGLALRRAGT